MKDTMETPTTLTTLLRHVAAKFPSRRAISVAAKFDLTHSRLHRLVESAAAQLVSAGVKPGDVVALLFPKPSFFPADNQICLRKMIISDSFTVGLSQN